MEEQSRVPTCYLCGENYSLPGDDVEGNLPRVLLCAHIYCSSCLQPLEQNNTIRCPQCQMESTLPEGGVDGLNEDSRIIGLLYTAKMNKKRAVRSSRPPLPRPRVFSKVQLEQDEDENSYLDLQKYEQEVDEALVRGTENMAQLESLRQTLETSLKKQVSREKSRMASEINQAASKAIHSVQKWKDRELEKLTTLESQFVKPKAQLQELQERKESLQLACQKAREVRRVPFLKKYCPLDKVLETLRAPVENQCDVLSLSELSEQRFYLNSQTGQHSLSLVLDLSSDQNNGESSPVQCQQSETNGTGTSLPEFQLSLSTGSKSPSLNGSSSPCVSPHGSTVNLGPGDNADGSPEIVIEEMKDDGLQPVKLPASAKQFAKNRTRIQRKKSPARGYSQIVTQWVVVSHILNPNHFYVQYAADKRERETLSWKIKDLCSKESSYLSTYHTVDTGSLIFVKYEDGLWHRAKVVEVTRVGYPSAVKSCPVSQISSLQVFFIDSGLTTTITIKSEDRESEALLKDLNNYLRRVSNKARAELDPFVPMAICCSLKDLVPYDLTKGWSKEAQAEFHSMVDSTRVKMHLLGQDKDVLLVDLKKVPAKRASGPHISVREHLVFIEVARYYSPVTMKKKTLLYYPPVPPKTHTELNAVVSHIYTPGDFYVQLVDNMESLLLRDKLQNFYNSPQSQREDLKIYCPVIGDACVALFEDKLWYRAQITDHPGGRKVEVLYVDFGNKGILSPTDLRKIKDEYFALPALALHCCLSDVIPLNGRDWSDASSSLFIELANQKLVTIVATAKKPRNGPVPVKLFDSGLNGPLDNIGEKLVKAEMALFKDCQSCKCVDFAIWDPPLEQDLDDLSSSGTDPNSAEFEPHFRLPIQLKDVKVQVSHVNSPSSFYVQFTKYDSRLKRVCELLKQECAHREAEDVQWKAGMYCAAHINGVWERAQICSDVLSNNIAEVIRCDHGNKNKVHISSLRHLRPELEGALALECTLCDIRPAGGRTTWTATACDFTSSTLSGALGRLTAKNVSEERPVAVTLSFSNSMGQFVSFADFLVSKGLALRERTPQTDTANSETGKTRAAEATHDCFPCSPNTLSSLNTPCTLSSLNTPGTLSSPNTPGTLSSPNTPGTLSSPNTPGTLSSPNTPGTLSSPNTPGTLSSPNTPGTLSSPNTPDTLRSLNTLSSLRDPSTLSSLSIPETLSSLSTPGTLSSLSTPGTLSSLTTHDTLSSLSTPSTLSTSSVQSNISALSTPCTPSPSVLDASRTSSSAKPKPPPRIFNTTEMIKTPTYEAPDLPCPGHLIMKVSAIGEDGTIYGRTLKAERQLENLKKKIQQSMPFNPGLRQCTWKTVQGCMIHGPDTLWYRGHRLEMLGGYIKVQYVDYGHAETIPAVHIQPLLMFDDVPQLCVPCQLYAISPLGGHWQRDAVALLNELLLNRSVDVHILELPVDPRGLLTVDMFLDGLSVSLILSENNHGSLTQATAFSGPSSFSAPTFLDVWDIDTEDLLDEDFPFGSFIDPEFPQEGKQFPVRVKHLWTPNELFLWPQDEMSELEINGETLDEAMDHVNDAIETLPRLSCFPQGGPCLAEYSDGKFYRAKILDISSVEPALIMVQHVDYGSDDTLPPSKLRQMPPELLRFPTCALKVKVAGFRAPSERGTEAALPYSPNWSVRAAMDMINLLHGRISATVLAREPELTVRLFNEKGDPVHLPLVYSGLAELD